MKEKILITGANGFIGLFLITESLKRGLDVYAGVRKNSDITSLESLGVNIIILDYNDADNLTNIFVKYKFEYVIHNAGMTKSPSLDQLTAVNKGLLVHLLHAIEQARYQPKKLVYMSSLASYGPAEFHKNGIITDESTPHPVTKYGQSKLAAEQYLQSQSIVPYHIIRPTAVYGPGEKDLFNVFKMINNYLDVQPALLGQKLTFIYVKDLAKLVVTAALSPQRNTSYFATDGNVYTGTALSGFIKEYLKKRTLSIKLPIFMMKGLAFITEKVAGIWGNYPIFNMDKVNEFKASSWNCDISNLSTDLNFKAEYDLTTGIPETIVWYKENKWL